MEAMSNFNKRIIVAVSMFLLIFASVFLTSVPLFVRGLWWAAVAGIGTYLLVRWSHEPE